MAITKGKLFDRLRRRWVADLPEERIRQAVIAWMLDFGGYPQSLLCSEKQLLHVEDLEFDQTFNTAPLPLRRFDLLCLMRSDAGFKPLLLIECKAARLTHRAKKQALDYNYHIKAPFIALAGAEDCLFAMLQTSCTDGHPHWQSGLPTHTALNMWLKASN